MNSLNAHPSKYLILPIWIIAIFSLGRLITAAPNIFLWLISSFFLLALLEPSWNKLIKKKVPAPVAAVLLVLGATVAFALIVSILGYLSADILTNLQESKRALIQTYESLNSSILKFLENFSGVLKGSGISPKVQKVEVIEGSFFGGGMGLTIMHGLGSAVTVLTYAILVPILTLFMMLCRSTFAKVIPLGFQDPSRAEIMWKKMVAANRAFFIGNLILALVSFPFFSILFYLFSVKSPLTMAALSSVFNLIPFLGAALSGFLPSLDLISQGSTVALSFGLFASCIAIHFIVANFVTPRVLGSKVDLNAVISTIAIIVWGELWGPAGILLAIPITACIKIVFEHSGFPWLHWLAALMSERPENIMKTSCGRSEGIAE
ncbi:MAG: AI-2E family transporter [Bdellovibrio sp.]